MCVYIYIYIYTHTCAQDLLFQATPLRRSASATCPYDVYMRTLLGMTLTLVPTLVLTLRSTSSNASTNTIVVYAVPYRTVPYRTIPYHAIPYMPYHTISYRTVPYQSANQSSDCVKPSEIQVVSS